MAECLRHRVAVAGDQHGGAEFDALRLFGDAGESDPYVVAEGGNLGAPDRAKTELFGKKRVLDGSGARRQAKVIGQHGALQRYGFRARGGARKLHVVFRAINRMERVLRELIERSPGSGTPGFASFQARPAFVVCLTDPPERCL
jgi:hypothetical protein